MIIQAFCLIFSNHHPNAGQALGLQALLRYKETFKVLAESYNEKISDSSSRPSERETGHKDLGSRMPLVTNWCRT
jgi:hypothetical protein